MPSGIFAPRRGYAGGGVAPDFSEADDSYSPPTPPPPDDQPTYGWLGEYHPTARQSLQQQLPQQALEARQALVNQEYAARQLRQQYGLSQSDASYPTTPFRRTMYPTGSDPTDVGALNIPGIPEADIGAIHPLSTGESLNLWAGRLANALNPAGQVQGIAHAATYPARWGEVPQWDPVTGHPSAQAMQEAAGFGQLYTGMAGAIPAEGFELRTGANVAGQRPSPTKAKSETVIDDLSRKQSQTMTGDSWFKTLSNKGIKEEELAHLRDELVGNKDKLTSADVKGIVRRSLPEIVEQRNLNRQEPDLTMERLHADEDLRRQIDDQHEQTYGYDPADDNARLNFYNTHMKNLTIDPNFTPEFGSYFSDIMSREGATDYGNLLVLEGEDPKRFQVIAHPSQSGAWTVQNNKGQHLDASGDPIVFERDKAGNVILDKNGSPTIYQRDENDNIVKDKDGNPVSKPLPSPVSFRHTNDAQRWIRDNDPNWRPPWRYQTHWGDLENPIAWLLKTDLPLEANVPWKPEHLDHVSTDQNVATGEVTHKFRVNDPTARDRSGLHYHGQSFDIPGDTPEEARQTLLDQLEQYNPRSATLDASHILEGQTDVHGWPQTYRSKRVAVVAARARRLAVEERAKELTSQDPSVSSDWAHAQAETEIPASFPENRETLVPSEYGYIGSRTPDKRWDHRADWTPDEEQMLQDRSNELSAFHRRGERPPKDLEDDINQLINRKGKHDQTHGNGYGTTHQGVDFAFSKEGGRVPKMPFAGKSGWQEAALKAGIIDAIENGKDALSWRTGEDVAGNWMQTQGFDELHYSPHDPDVNGPHLVAFRRGRQVWESDPTQESKSNSERLDDPKNLPLLLGEHYEGRPPYSKQLVKEENLTNPGERAKQLQQEISELRPQLERARRLREYIWRQHYAMEYPRGRNWRSGVAPPLSDISHAPNINISERSRAAIERERALEDQINDRQRELSRQHTTPISGPYYRLSGTQGTVGGQRRKGEYDYDWANIINKIVKKSGSDAKVQNTRVRLTNGTISNRNYIRLDQKFKDYVRQNGLEKFWRGGRVIARKAGGRVDRSHDVPYLAGESKDHRCTYVDRRVPKTLLVAGRKMDPAKYLKVHEEIEHTQMTKHRLPYQRAHQVALHHERRAVELDGHDWDAYQRKMHSLAEHVTGPEKVTHPPPDLYTKPYPPKQAAQLERKGRSSFKEGGVPATSKAQYRFMAAVKHNPDFAKAAGVPQSVGREFVGKPEHKFYESLPARRASGGSAIDQAIFPLLKMARQRKKDDDEEKKPELQSLQRPLTGMTEMGIPGRQYGGPLEYDPLGSYAHGGMPYFIPHPSRTPHPSHMMMRSGHPGAAPTPYLGTTANAAQPYAPKIGHVGGLLSPVAGRTDHIPIDVPNGSYVLPADVISGMGEGNTIHGTRVANHMFHGSFRRPRMFSSPRGTIRSAGGVSSGVPGLNVPIMAAGGEYVIGPETVARVGGGDMKHGHKVLDLFVRKVRNNTIKTLKHLPPPAKK